jgi:hypothetical protein
MPSFAMTVPHRLTQEEALGRIQRMLGEMKQQYGNQVTDLNETWNGNTGEFSMTAMGMKISGNVAVEPGEVKLNGNIPFAAVPFKGQIEKLIREQATQLLA